ncbi:MAG: hypothetical protein ACE5JM_11470, partial [Armatimonadota bacterium]
LSATKVRRDGELLVEYYGSNWVQRRDLSYVHPASIQMRDAFLRECVLGEQVFDTPLDLQCGGCASGVWFDNPGNVAVSYDAYANALVAREFARKFGDRYPDPKAHKPWYCDPPHFWITEHDDEVRRWYEKFWADAYAGYYAWQYGFLQREIAPKLGREHLFVGGNSKLNWSTSSWDYYLFSWPGTYDTLGPNETTTMYSNKEAPGLKLALAASNGKPGGVWRAPKHPGYMGEMLACLGVTVNATEEQDDFHRANRNLYHNAMPGAGVAVLYHLLDGIHHSEIATLARVCDQVWRAGFPLEVITELHLSPGVLARFDVLIVPGFRFAAGEVAALRAYLEGGGKMVLIGDNRDGEGGQLSEVLGGAAAFTDGQAGVGEGVLRSFGTQLITQAQMTEAIEGTGATAYRILRPQGEDLLLNVLLQPQLGATELHLVNYTNEPVRDVTVRLPSELRARPVALVSPRGHHQALEPRNDAITIPELVGYAVAVVCPDQRTRDAILAQNAGIEDQPAPTALAEALRKSAIAEEQVEPEDLEPGERLAHLRQSGRAGFRRVDVDVVTRAEGRVGQSQPIRLKLHAVGVWSAQRVHFDRVKFVMVNVETGEREEAAVDVRATGTGAADDLVLHAAAPVLRDTVTDWTPTKPGRYQLYLGYRYVHEVFDGRPGEPNEQRPTYRMGDYMFGRPFLKLSYEERLPTLVVDVAEGQG